MDNWTVRKIDMDKPLPQEALGSAIPEEYRNRKAPTLGVVGIDYIRQSFGVGQTQQPAAQPSVETAPMDEVNTAEQGQGGTEQMAPEGNGNADMTAPKQQVAQIDDLAKKTGKYQFFTTGALYGIIAGVGVFAFTKLRGRKNK